jgi:hypothetical protein
MKKIVALILVIFFIFTAGIIYGGDKEIKQTRDNYYSTLIKAFNFPGGDCKYIRQKGYGPYFSLVMLYISKETGQPISDIVSLRDNNGYSWGDICRKYNVAFTPMMQTLKSDIIKYKITFPADTGKEMKKNIVTVKRKEAK